MVYGGKGKDNLVGYGGDTSLDRFYGGPGDDLMQPGDRPAVKDAVRCGPGTDTVYAGLMESRYASVGAPRPDCRRTGVRLGRA